MDSLVPVSGCNRGSVQQVAGQVFHHELVVRDICIESANEVVPVAPGSDNREIEFMALGVCISDHIHPVPGPAFSKVRGSEQSIDQLFVSIGDVLV